MPTTYKRKTNNPKLAWSSERREAWSQRIREDQSNGKWFKKSKKKIGQAISEGRKAASKRRNLSLARKKGWEKRRQNGNGISTKTILNHPPTSLSNNYCPVVDPIKDSLTSESILQVQNFLDQMEKEFGVACLVEDFVKIAIQEKIARIKSIFAE